ncbi:MAG: hypothetical protein R2828_17335 [Saprospiraceae bacterium]
MRRILLLTITTLLFYPLFGQQPAFQYKDHKKKKQNYFVALDDARLDLGLKFTSIIALDDRAKLSSNPHFQAMWNLIKLGATLESLLQGQEAPLNDINLGQEFGQNGYNKTVLTAFISYGFGESSDVKIPIHFFELAVSSGYFKQGKKGMNLHVDYRANILKTAYGAGGNSIGKAFDYEVFVGARAGFDWSFSRSESEAGFFSHLNKEIERVAAENEFTAAQLISLEQLAETSKVLLPEDVGGGAFHIGPIAGATISKKIGGSFHAFASGVAFYDVMDLTAGKAGQENKRSQHAFSIEIGVKATIGAEGSVTTSFF